MKYSIDRIDNGVAVMITENGERRISPVTLLPDGCKEGSVLLEKDGKFLHDLPAETKRRRRFFLLQRRVFKKQRQDTK